MEILADEGRVGKVKHHGMEGGINPLCGGYGYFLEPDLLNVLNLLLYKA